jgi:hypothetical protein
VLLGEKRSSFIVICFSVDRSTGRRRSSVLQFSLSIESNLWSQIPTLPCWMDDSFSSLSRLAKLDHSEILTPEFGMVRFGGASQFS